MFHPEFPVVDGRHQMTPDWVVTLPMQFNRRIEDGSLVLWRPGITVWTIIWNNDKRKTHQERLEWLSGDTSPNAFDAKFVIDGDVTQYSYRLTERREEGIVHALHVFAIGVDGHVQMSIYFDDEANLDAAREICRSLEETHET
jgi:hypothetical protein